MAPNRAALADMSPKMVFSCGCMRCTKRSGMSPSCRIRVSNRYAIAGGRDPAALRSAQFGQLGSALFSEVLVVASLSIRAEKQLTRFVDALGILDLIVADD